MSRAKWKGPYIKKKALINTIDKKFSRESVILPKFVDSELLIHTGKNFSKIIVLEEMIGHKFGELILTRKFFSYKKK
jgi:small subunit ribosomal protein S19